MSEGVRVALISGGFVFLGVIATVYGSRFVARVSAKSQEEARKLEESKVAAGVAAEKAKIESQSYERASKHLLITIGELRTDVQNLRTAQAEDSQRHRQELGEQDDRHRKQIAELREERREQLTALNERLDELEAQRSSDKQRIEALEVRNDALSSYIRQLIRVLRDNELVPPQAPPGMTFD